MSKVETVAGDSHQQQTINEQQAKPESALVVTEIKDVEPLSLQIDAVEPCTVPKALHEPLFGQPKPTQDELEQYGSVEAVPWLNTYAILAAAKMPYLLTALLEESGLRHQSLFQGTTQYKLGEQAPYLVELKDKNSLTRRLFTGAKGVNGLWEKELGIYLRSRASFDEVRRHFRKFTHIQDENGKWFFFAFAEPRHLANALKGFSLDQLSLFFDKRIIFEALSFTTYECLRIQVNHDKDIASQNTLILTSNILRELGNSVEKDYYRVLKDDATQHENYSDDFFNDILQVTKKFALSSRNVIRDFAFWCLDAGCNIAEQDYAGAELEASRGMPDQIRFDRLKNLSQKVLQHGK